MIAVNTVVDDKSLHWHPALDVGDHWAPLNMIRSSFTFLDDEDLRVLGHQSACLCKSVKRLFIDTFSQSGDVVMRSVPSELLLHSLWSNGFILISMYVYISDTLVGVGLHIIFNLSLHNSTECQRKKNMLGSACSFPYVFSRVSLPLTCDCPFPPESYLVFYLPNSRGRQ